jgi:[acyl-carrier-protein] S-malonyltransferase
MQAVIFPGQGSQYSGMGQDLYQNYPQAQKIFDAIDNAAGFKLSEKCFSGSAEELKDTAIQQLAILAVSLAAYEVFKTTDKEIGYLSGLSLGEYSCLYPASVVSLSDLVVLVKQRAQAMQQAAKENPATMFAVLKLSPEKILQLQDDTFYVANLNSPKQIVISTSVANKQQVKEKLTAQGARLIELAVSGGFHSPFMQPAKDKLAEVIKGIEFSNATIPIVSNVDAKPHQQGEQIKENLLNQLTNTVRWNDCINYINSQQVNQFFEIGPSRILKGLVKKINPQLEVTSLGKQEDFNSLLK